ncbi:MAG: deoxyribonuclease IV [Deltaproteobacteria bacterium]|nr:deoxyribonuclease IV [Deltaproteobacteria bacterium]
MLLGGHESTAGGLARAFGRARADGCEALQVFTASPRRWEAPRLPPTEVEAWHTARAATPEVRAVVAHAGYLPNPATPNPALAARTLATLTAEIDRCEALGIPLLVLHPGTGPRGDEPRASAVERAAVTLAVLHAARPSARVVLCVECTVGQGLGGDPAEIGDILARAEAAGADPDRLGTCLDTAHLHGAGHVLAEDGWDRVMDAFEAAVGRARIRAVHLNDTAVPLGSRRDRHAPLGEGALGLAVFRRIVNDSRLGSVPGILETPFDATLPAPRRAEIGLLLGLRA